ncbi:MAG: site-specific DNA-methyltransferase [Thermoproteota archaeon]|jgi:site-specific DNA-methyltransferase (adenine-specific)/site-specific DNA-methyltransferase (cytosine-N4-specific)|nr:site-specific DNA-methyltransferase [Thermoproteota archaeon]
MFVKIIFGNSENMKEINSGTVHLVVTSPPYYNAPFDFPNLYNSYEEFLRTIEKVGKEIFRILQNGRMACFVTQDVRINGKLYPIVSDLTRIMQDIGFEYQERIIWRKPEGYIRISRRSGVIIQHPYPMYYFPDNIYEDIIIFKKPGKFEKNILPDEIKQKSKIDLKKFQEEKWYLSVWDIKNVLPSEKWSKYTAAFPEELVERIITLYSYYGETVLEPFLGTGTTCIVAKRLGRNFIGYEIDLELKDVIEERIGIKNLQLTEYLGLQEKIEIVVREDAKRLRSKLRSEIEKKLAEK